MTKCNSQIVIATQWNGVSVCSHDHFKSHVIVEITPKESSLYMESHVAKIKYRTVTSTGWCQHTSTGSLSVVFTIIFNYTHAHANI